MPCNRVDLPGGGYAIVCTRGRKPSKPCSSCGRYSNDMKLCDFPLTGSKQGKTCDRSVCSKCAVHRDPDTDYCPPHGRLIEAREAQEGKQQGLDL